MKLKDQRPNFIFSEISNSISFLFWFSFKSYFFLSCIFPHSDVKLLLKLNNEHSDFDTHFPEMFNVA